MGCNKSSSKKEVYSQTSLPQEVRKVANKQPNLIPKLTRGRIMGKKKNKPKVSRRKEIIKIRAEKNEKYTKR